MRLLSFALLLAFALLPSLASAQPKFQVADCGAVIPSGASSLGARRYAASGYSDLFGLRKFYNKVFGSGSKRIDISLLVSTSAVTAYHIRSTSPETRWQGINIAHYRSNSAAPLQIFILCR